MAENGTVVTVVEASGDGYISYEIAGGADAAAFVIDAYTGVLEFSGAADFEALGDSDQDNVYEVTVRASDGLTSADQQLRVQLQNVNEAVTITSGAAFAVLENATAVTVVSAVDGDGDPIGFALAGGADAALFDIDAATGALSFKNAPSFEAPADFDGDNIYEVEVSASDGSLTDTRTVSVHVADHSESIAFVSGGGGDSAAVTLSENSGDVLGLLAVDPDGSAPQYGISGGADAASFEIDPATGMLRFKDLPDFEAPGDADGNNVYEVTVAATDGESSDHQSVSVTVANAYEGVSFAAPSRAFALDEGSLGIGSVSARGEAGASIAYSISGGADSALFSVDSTTGALSWIAAPDFDSPADSGGDNVYDLIVTAGDGTASATQAVSVTVGNVDERPVFAPGGTQLGIDEGNTAVTILAAADPEGAAVGFAIAGGADAALFAIDSATGALSFLAAPDFEAPADSGGDNVYEVEVSASDGQLSQTRSLSIAVADLSPPVALGDEFVVNATFQRTQAHSDVTRLADGNFVVTWIDADFNTTAGRFLRAQVFAPDGVKIGGELTLASGSGVGTEPAVAALPDGGFVVASRPLGSIAVQMFDSAGTATSAKLTVSNAGSGVGEPQIAVLANGGFAVTWDDSRSTGTDVSGSGVHLRVYDSAGAPVGGDVLVNTSTAGNQADPSISALAGGGYVVTWTDRPGQGASWVAKAQIFDSAGARVGGEFVVSGSSSGFATVVETSVVTLSNGNFAVAWSESDESGPAHRIQIFTPAGVKVGGQIVAPSNAYGTSVGPSLTALSDGGFAVAWSPNNPPQSDGSGKAIFVQAYDSAGLAKGPATRVNGQANGDQLDPSIAGLGDGRFVVTWTDLNGAGADDDQVMARIFAPEGHVLNQRPVITSDASVVIDEGRSDVTTVAATDSDGPDAVTYSIAGGADAALFRIDSATGALSFIAPPDYEAPAAGSNNVYAVTVKAGDGELSSLQSLLVTVRNVNEGVAIATGPALVVNEDSAFVAKVAATDGDGDPLSYAIAGGADAAHFIIDPETGDLSVRGSLDYEAPADADGDNVYEVTVRASDGRLFDDRQMSITVADVYDDVEIVSYGGAGSVSLAVQESGSFQVADVDASMSSMSGVTFAIAGGADASLFTIDPADGELSFNYPFMPDFEAPGDADGDNVYDVVVVARMGTSSDSQAFAITVTNRNESLWITSDGHGDANLSVDEGGRLVTTVTAYDPDGDVPAYSILGGADASKFAIDSATGVLTFIADPDYESPQSAAGTNLYTVEVGAGDGEHMSRQMIRVAVNNVNEGVTITSGGGGNSAAVTVNENGLAVTAIAAGDVDGDPLTYSISGGADSARFAIDARTGALSFVQAPNFEAPADSGGNNVYDVVVSVSDGAFTDSQAIAVTVANVNEAVAITSNGGGAGASLTVAENGTAVTVVGGSDPDGGAVTYAIAGGADSARFTIDASTGALAFIAAPNFEAPSDSGANNVYDVIVSASDGAFTDTQVLAVTVGNVNEGVAIRSNGGGASAALTIAENGAAVTTVKADDADGGPLTYAIAGGADSGRFTIDAATGVLAFIAAPNFEAPADSGANNVYDVIVAATDGSFTATQALAVSVGNVNEGIAITSFGGGSGANVSVAENGRAVSTIAAADPDGTPTTYSIAGGADAARFTIDPRTGLLQFVSAPDHELPGDSNGDNVYAVIVRASDGQLSDDLALNVTVTNVRDGANITGTAGSDSISASSFSPALRTTNSEDTVFGRDGHDNIQGLAGDDELYGEGGNDTLTGGAGADRLSGGLGKDQFTYNSASESAGAARDLITDFSRSQGDKISLSAIDANSLVSNNQAFTFIGSAAFSNVAGQLRFETSGGVTTISGDINGDGVADLQIQLSGSIALIASDFIL
ncbi:MAG TPA: cadherin domain-containing protein [Allosphingosinicella sp.]